MKFTRSLCWLKVKRQTVPGTLFVVTNGTDRQYPACCYQVHDLGNREISVSFFTIVIVFVVRSNMVSLIFLIIFPLLKCAVSGIASAERVLGTFFQNIC